MWVFEELFQSPGNCLGLGVHASRVVVKAARMLSTPVAVFVDRPTVIGHHGVEINERNSTIRHYHRGNGVHVFHGGVVLGP
jgi:nitrous oxidase accessory protein NosD